jgi:hypothetical protein
VEWLAVTVVGFLAATGLVIVLGRRSTASWERHKKRRRTRRRTVVTRTPPSTGAGARLRGVLAQKAAVVRRGTGAVRKPLERGIAALGATSKRWLSPEQPARRDGDPRVGPVPKRARVSLLHPVRRDSVRRRRRLGLIRRRGRDDDARVARRR